MFSRRLLLCAVLVLAFAASALAAPGVRLGDVSVGVGYSHGPYYPYGYGAYGAYRYGPYGYGPFWDPFFPYWGPWPGYYPNAVGGNQGHVRLTSEYKKAPVYIEGAYAGVLGDLKTLSLAPGAYDIEIRPEGKASLSQRVYILTGKTIKI